MGRDQVGGRRGSADQSIRHHNLGHGHVQARDKHHDKLVYDALWRLLLETAVHLDEGERWGGRTHSCEPRHPLVEQAWKPALPSKAVYVRPMRSDRRRLRFGSHRTGSLHSDSSLPRAIATPNPATSSPGP